MGRRLQGWSELPDCSHPCPVLFGPAAARELPENWTDTRETLLEGVLFSLKYLGMTLVEQPKGEELSAAAVKRIVATAKASGKKLQKVTLKVSPRGIVLNDSGTNELIENVSIYRISYCTADKIHDKVFAYIAQNQLNENLECHAFLCTKRKMAQAVTLTVAQAFKIAFEFWQASKEEKEKRERSILEGEGVSSPNSAAPACPDASAATGNLLDLEDPAKLLLTSSENPTHLDNSMFGPSSSVNNNVVWVSLPRAPQNLLSWQGVMLPQSLCAPGPLLVPSLGQDPLGALGQLSCLLRISDLPKRAGFWCPTRNDCLVCESLLGSANKLKQLQATVKKCYCQIIEYYLLLHSVSQWFVT
ncbi:low density lipoprotein receptor adapter protein 1 isoform X3 [Excalfactoria chinensis]|uniref:low density lipoprotein receptor adapter protein 1 isoform X3 n=1 Tax=Excalfactoria chinensis TaxID=46218 RepID=UPI003B3AEF6D